MGTHNQHYVYKIVNLKNQKEYIGVRTHPNPQKDKYMGSGTCILKVIEIEGIDNFKKLILKTFDTREKAVEYESSLLTEEYCNSPNTYNIINTGSDGVNKHCFRKDLWYDYYNDIRIKYLNNYTPTELAKFYNCDKGTIRIICEDLLRSGSESQYLRFQSHPSTKRNSYLDENVIKITEMYKGGLNTPEIARIFNTSVPMIRRRIIENNIPLRGRGNNK